MYSAVSISVELYVDLFVKQEIFISEVAKLL